MKNNIIQNLACQNIADWWETYGDKLNHALPKTKLKGGEGFFHYAPLAAALSILNIEENKESSREHICLWASHFLFLNDEQELSNGLDIVCSALKKELDQNPEMSDYKDIIGNYYDIFSKLTCDKLHDTPNHFILCFCSHGNLKEQWQLYGKDCGVAIEFDLPECLIDGFYPPSAQYNENQQIPAIPRAVHYKDDNKKRCVEKIIARRIKDLNANNLHVLMRQVLAAASFMKHPCFQAEKETRLLFLPSFYCDEHSAIEALKLVQYREHNDTIKPYMKVNFRHRSGDVRNLIKSVTVGPGKNQQLVVNAILKLLQTRFSKKIEMIPHWEKCNANDYEHTNIAHIQVRRSTLPFRG